MMRPTILSGTIMISVLEAIAIPGSIMLLWKGFFWFGSSAKRYAAVTRVLIAKNVHKVADLGNLRSLRSRTVFSTLEEVVIGCYSRSSVLNPV